MRANRLNLPLFSLNYSETFLAVIELGRLNTFLMIDLALTILLVNGHFFVAFLNF